MQRAQDGSMWPDSPVPLTDGERQRRSEATVTIFVPGAPAFLYVFFI